MTDPLLPRSVDVCTSAGHPPEFSRPRAVPIQAGDEAALTHPAGGRGARREEGQALVEFALAIPFLLLLLTAILQFGSVYNQYEALTDAARTGARELAIEYASTDPCDAAINQTVASAAGVVTLPTGDVVPTFHSPTGGTTTKSYCGTNSGGGCTTTCLFRRRRERRRRSDRHGQLPRDDLDLWMECHDSEPVDGVIGRGRMSQRRRLGSLRSERGQVLPLVVIAAVVLIGFTGLAIDLGRVWVAKQQLQRAVDAATLAAGQDLPDSATALSDAQAYAANGTRNPLSGWGVTASAPNITFECNSSGPGYTSGSTPICLTDSSGDSCHPSNTSGGTNQVLPAGATTCNEVHVSESATVTTGLLSLFIPNFTP